MLTAQQISQKWLTNFGNATTAMTDGVNSVQTAPGQLAAAQATLWLQRLQQSQQKWINRVSAVSLQDWKSAMISLGIPRAQQGAAAKQTRYTAFITEYMNFLASAVPAVRAMPKGSLSASIARASAMITQSYNWGQSRA
jgi:5-methylcytosine-specific restriction endonuclease McrBC GTP-binding regulatory subunit McrB